ncbi:MAG: thioredoxin fold domain-containing protein [Bacteroidetes bacterium]|nr:thioredoxin fold domain-containing protein [Bacteroidota bacterium]
MRKIIFNSVLIAALFLSANLFAEDVKFSTGTYQEILDLAKSGNKTIMIDFITDWCKWCVETDRKVYTDPKVSSYANENQINWKIDAEKGEGPELAKKYGVKGYPTIIFTNSSGDEIDRIYGYLPADIFLTRMMDYNNGVNTYGDLKNKLETSPDDPELNYLMAEKISSNGLDGDVKVYLNKTISADPGNLKGYTDDAKFMLAYMNEDAAELQRLIGEYPESNKVKDGYMNLASYYEDKNDPVKADELFSKAFSVFGENDFDLMQNYGSLLLGRAYGTMKNENAADKDRENALITLEKSIKYVGGTVNEASAYYIMSELYLQLKDIKKAEESIDKAISIYDKKSYRDQKDKITKLRAEK